MSKTLGVDNTTIPPGFELILAFLRPIEHLILDPEISEIMWLHVDRHSPVPDRRIDAYYFCTFNEDGLRAIDHLLAVTPQIQWFALLLFALSSALQSWAMIRNPFFSPVVRIQSEHGRHLVESGLSRFVRHPGYLAMSMSISISPSAGAISSWFGLFPATAFVIVIRYRAEIEDQFVRANLSGYAEYAKRLHSGVLLDEGRPRRPVENARSVP